MDDGDGFTLNVGSSNVATPSSLAATAALPHLPSRRQTTPHTSGSSEAPAAAGSIQRNVTGHASSPLGGATGSRPAADSQKNLSQGKKATNALLKPYQNQAAVPTAAGTSTTSPEADAGELSVPSEPVISRPASRKHHPGEHAGTERVPVIHSAPAFKAPSSSSSTPGTAAPMAAKRWSATPVFSPLGGDSSAAGPHVPVPQQQQETGRNRGAPALPSSHAQRPSSSSAASPAADSDAPSSSSSSSSSSLPAGSASQRFGTWTDDPAMLLAESFSALPLDPRLLAKLTAAASSSSSASSAAAASATSSAVAGVARGHLRDGFGLTRPTRVQRMFLPRALAGHSVLARSETGSGKTLAFLLPIVQGLLALNDGTPGGLSRNTLGGTRALILAPTRELCQQIFEVATRLLQPFPFLVPGIVAGGEKRKSEKARLRRGCVLLVATPGRLLDHLRTTEAFDTRSLGWLVLDEADRLLDLGFGAQIGDIVGLLRQRLVASPPASPPQRASWTTYLLSATLSTSVKQLAASVIGPEASALLLDASMAGAVRQQQLQQAAQQQAEPAAAAGAAPSPAEAAGDEEESSGAAETDGAGAVVSSREGVEEPQQRFATPSRLAQQVAIVAIKWRLVTLLAATLDAVGRASKGKQRQQARAQAAASAASADAAVDGGAAPSAPSASRGAKLIVFLSTTDSVDFHFELFGKLLPLMLDGEPQAQAPAGSSPPTRRSFAVMRLHGNMPQAERTTTFRTFGAVSSGVLLATDVAARGLDLPDVDVIIQADAPSDTHDYVHRIGRTARKGCAGRALILLQPHEAGYADLLRAAGMTSLSLVETGPMLGALARSRAQPLQLLQRFLPAGAVPPEATVGAGGESGAKRKRAGTNPFAPEAIAAAAAAAAAPRAAAGSISSGAERAAAVTRIRGLASAATDALASHNARRSSELLAVLWQAVAEEVVACAPGDRTPGSPPLLTLARDAFVSFVRGYATHEKSVRHIFHTRALHTGHCAKAFGLKEAPSLAVSRGKGSTARLAAEAAAAATAAAEGGAGGKAVPGKQAQYQSAAKQQAPGAGGKPNGLHWASQQPGAPTKRAWSKGSQGATEGEEEGAAASQQPSGKGPSSSFQSSSLLMSMADRAADAADAARGAPGRRGEGGEASTAAGGAEEEGIKRRKLSGGGGGKGGPRGDAGRRGADAPAAAAAGGGAGLGGGGFNSKASWKVPTRPSRDAKPGKGGAGDAGAQGAGGGEGDAAAGKQVLHHAARAAQKRAAVSEFAA